MDLERRAAHDGRTIACHKRGAQMVDKAVDRQPGVAEQLQDRRPVGLGCSFDVDVH
jgi:hypothetical protein